MAKVSVVMPVLDNGRFLRAALQSILGQTFDNLEVIVVDGGSTDDTRTILDEFQRRDQRVLAIHEKGLGLAASLNRGIDIATGKYIARMDGDDVAFPTRIRKQVEFLEDHPRVAVLGSSVTIMDEKDNPGETIKYPATDAEIKATLLSYNCIAHPTVLMRRDAFASSSGYRQTFEYAEDYDLWLRLAESYEFANLSEPTVYYRVLLGEESLEKVGTCVQSTLAAQRTAILRRQCGRDPAEGLEKVTPELLRQLGLSRELVLYGSVESFLWRANLALSLRNSRAAMLICERARALARDQHLPRRIGAQLMRTEARACLAGHQLPKGLALAMAGSLLHPESAGSVLGLVLSAIRGKSEPEPPDVSGMSERR